jgi:hypothetical protein
VTRLIALSAAYGAGGSIIGAALAERLGVPFLDRAIPLAVADRLEVSYDDAAAHDEKVGAGWLERVLTAFATGDPGVPTPLPDDALSADDFRRSTTSCSTRPRSISTPASRSLRGRRSA